MRVRLRRPVHVFALLSGLALITQSSCVRPAAPEGPTAESVASNDLETYWDAALTVLRRHDLQPDRQDLGAGVITTLPTTSQQWFEWWRQDVAEPYGFAEASLHTVQRNATVRFTKKDDGNWDVQVQVEAKRLSAPESQITSASSAIQSFSGVLPTAEGAMAGQAQARQWVPLGRDEAMEKRLLSAILFRAERLTGPIEPPLDAQTQPADSPS